jgi:hypothetical protein
VIARVRKPIYESDSPAFIVLLGGYFTMRGRFDSGGFFSSAGEITNVAHTFQPSGRCAASNSL